MGISIIGINIKKIREKKNITAYRLAKEANVGAATISEIESGARQSLNSKTIEKISAALEVSVNELLSLEEDIDYIVTDIEQVMDVILQSEELVLDNISLDKKEIEQLKLAFDSVIKSIRIQRGE